MKKLVLLLLLSAPLAQAGLTKADYLTTRTVKTERGSSSIEAVAIAPKTKDAEIRIYRSSTDKNPIIRKISAGSGKHVITATKCLSSWYAEMRVGGRVTDKETKTRKTGRGFSRKGLDSSKGLR